MKKLKKITVAELAEEIWNREGVRVVFHATPEMASGNYRFSRSLSKHHTIAHLHDRIERRLQVSFGLNWRHGYTVVLGNGMTNPRSDMHMRTARKTYAA